jgi:hypothetical protein
LLILAQMLGHELSWQAPVLVQVNSGISLISKYIPGLLDPLLNRVGNSNRSHCAYIKEACLEIERALPSSILGIKNHSPNFSDS